jgi:molybdopterin converting factor small subunit
MAVVTVRFWAAAKAAAGTGSEAAHAETVGELLGELAERHGPELGRVLVRCSVLVDGSRARPGDPLHDGRPWSCCRHSPAAESPGGRGVGLTRCPDDRSASPSPPLRPWPWR